MRPPVKKSPATGEEVVDVAANSDGRRSSELHGRRCELRRPLQVQLEPTSQWALLRRDAFGQSKYTGMLQATKDMFREEGLPGFWRGNVPALLMVMPYTAIQFTVLHKLKSFVSGSSKSEDHMNLSPYLSYLSGALAGCAATVRSYPFDLIRTILASQGEAKVYPNMRSAFTDIIGKRGIRGLYARLTPTLIEIVPYGLQFGTYDTFKTEGHY